MNVVEEVLAELGTKQICRCGATLASFAWKCSWEFDLCEGRRRIIDSVNEHRRKEDGGSANRVAD